MEMVELHVRMCCNGCERTIRKALSKVKGIESVDIDLIQNKVTATGYVDRKKVLKAVRNTGKTAEFWAQQYYYNQVYQQTNGYSNPQMYSRTYNYQKHGYNDNNGYETTYDDSRNGTGTTMFSDENPNSCSVM